MSSSAEEDTWVSIHERGYAAEILSITQDGSVRGAMIRELRRVTGHDLRVLVPGCGSTGLMERDIARRLTRFTRVLCTDFEKVAAIARAQNDNPRIVYEGRDSADLGFKNAFHAAVVLNAVVSGDDETNRKMIACFHDALLPGGKMIGLFPTVICSLDVSQQLPQDAPAKWSLLRHMNFKTCTTTSADQTMQQVHYTPLRLRQIIAEAGFELEKMELYFLDTPYLRREVKRIYGFEDKHTALYELFVVARKPAP